MLIVQPIMEEGLHRNGLFGDTNNSEEQRSDCGTSECWRYVLDRVLHLHLPDVQGDAGIATCIRDALLYGCAEFGTVSGKNNKHSKFQNQTFLHFYILLAFSNLLTPYTTNNEISYSTYSFDGT